MGLTLFPRPHPPSRTWSVSLYPWPQAPRARQLLCSSEDPKGAGSDRGEQLRPAQGLHTCCCPLPFVREIKTSPLLLAIAWMECVEPLSFGVLGGVCCGCVRATDPSTGGWGLGGALNLENAIPRRGLPSSCYQWGDQSPGAGRDLPKASYNSVGMQP